MDSPDAKQLKILWRGEGDNRWVEVRDAGEKGVCVFSLKDFKKGDMVYAFKKGQVINTADISKLPEENRGHIDKVGKDLFEVIEPPACYVNHSCDPNVMEQQRRAYALRDIKNGEEITIDYDLVAFFDTPVACHCGAKNCRGLVRGR